jgi:hypothetical protein
MDHKIEQGKMAYNTAWQPNLNCQTVSSRLRKDKEYFTIPISGIHVFLVLLPGFQKGRDIKDRISLLLGSIKCFPLRFNTFKTL